MDGIDLSSEVTARIDGDDDLEICITSTDRTIWLERHEWLKLFEYIGAVLKQEENES